MTTATLQPSRLPAADVFRVGAVGLRTRRLRAALSALGIAIGIASMVAVLGISQSSKADLLAQLDRLGTNLLTISPGQSFFGDNSTLPDTSVAALRGLADVSSAASTANVSAATVRRSRYVDPQETNGISVVAADTGLLTSLGGGLRSGRFLDGATARYPVVVLGAIAASRLAITSLATSPQVWIAGSWWSVGGILAPQALAPDIDRSALMGYPIAKARFGVEHNPSTIYVRTVQDRVTQAENVLGRTANPEHADEVQVSRPSDAIEARAAAKSAFTALFLGLGAVALLVGGVGIANVMVISVLERRSEIGLRRALGATRRHVTAQFLTESLLLAMLGGTAGVALGAVVTAAYAASQGWPIELPAVALGGGLGAALAIGAIAGIYPAARAARLSPTEALRSA